MYEIDFQKKKKKKNILQKLINESLNHFLYELN
jgi:hypothetical protein